MRYRILGKSGIKVSEIGFGAWGIGGAKQGSSAYGPTDDAESLRAISRAVDLGITFFDTSDLYGFGHSESLLGESLHSIRSKVVIASKAGSVDFSGAQDFSIPYIRRSLDNTLARLRTDYLDLYQLHSPSLDVLSNQELLHELKMLKQTGRVRSFGVSARSPDDALKVLEIFPCDVLQLNFNFADQRALSNGVFDRALESGTGIIIRTPLCFGFLTGKYAGDAHYDPSDHRSKWSVEQRNRWAGACELFMADLKERHLSTSAQLAIQYCLSFDAVSTVIPGMMTVDHVEENVRASDLAPFTDDELDAFSKIYSENDFFSRKA